MANSPKYSRDKTVEAQIENSRLAFDAGDSDLAVRFLSLAMDSNGGKEDRDKIDEVFRDIEENEERKE